MKDIMTSLADQVRRITKKTEKLGVVEMRDALADVVTENTSDATAEAAQILKPYTAYARGQKITGTMPTVGQASPSISVSISGLITASSTQSTGYVTGGTKSTTKQISTQPAKTIVPSTVKQTAVARGLYTTGEVEVAAVPTETWELTMSDGSIVSKEVAMI